VKEEKTANKDDKQSSSKEDILNMRRKKLKVMIIMYGYMFII
jgi:hypothetical protein